MRSWQVRRPSWKAEGPTQAFTCPQYALKSFSLHPVVVWGDVSSMMATYCPVGLEITGKP